MRRARTRGMALVVTMLVLAVLLVLAGSYATSVRTETILAGGYVRRTQAAWLAEAGLQRACLALRDNPDGFTALSADAANGEPLVLQVDSEDEGQLVTSGRYQVRAFDEAARLHLNVADEDTLRNLLGTDTQLVDAILDWRDEDEESRETGAESDYYASLQEPYLSRDDWFETVQEMLLLRDVTPARFFGAEGLSPLASPELVGTVDEQATPLDQVFTVYSQDPNVDLAGQQRVDVTTADRQTLLDQFGEVLSEQDVDAIIAYREGGGEAGAGGGAAPPEAAMPSPAAEALGPLAELAQPESEAQPPSGGQSGGQEQRRPASVAELLRVIDRDKLRQIYDRLTVSTDRLSLGLVNVNTASEEVLAALPGMDPDLAQLIVAERANQPFETVGDLLRLTEITPEVFEQVAPLLTTRSVAFRLQAEGTVGEKDQAVGYRIEIVVLMDLQPATDEATGESQQAPSRTLRVVYRKME